MKIAVECPSCGQRIDAEFPESAGELRCRACDWSRPIHKTDIEQGRPRRCLACGTEDLWRQKDFPQGLGLLLVGMGALFSTIAWGMYWPRTAIGILMGFALGDLLLYTFMNDVLVCYRCSAQHRQANMDADHPRFDLELAERYRQEAIRLEDSKNSNS